MDTSATSNAFQFNIPVEGARVKKHQVIAMHLIAAFLLIVMGIVTFITPIAIGIAQTDNSHVAKASLSWINWSGLIIALFGLVLIIANVFFNKKVIQAKTNLVMRIIEIIIFIAILVYSILNKWYLPAAYSGAALLGIIIAYYLEKAGSQTQYLHLDKNGIKIPGTGRTLTLAWHQVRKVIVKHNLITIDCTNNKLFQLTFDKTALQNKEQFEEFVHQNILANEQKRPDDW
jgi:hypothetical protein